MSNLQKSSDEAIEKNILSATVHRRSFFKFIGVSAVGLAITAESCKISQVNGTSTLGNGDFSILNYAYALEQLEGAFYIKVTQKFYAGASELEKDFLTDIRNDEIAHREWFREVLFLKKLHKLEFDFSSINFNDRMSVLNAAKEFEDTGVSAYNGAGKLLKFRPFLKQAGKIVSVEARHAATIRDLISYGDFAGDDVINSMGLDQAKTPQEVLSATSKYFKTKVDGSHLRKS